MAKPLPYENYDPQKHLPFSEEDKCKVSGYLRKADKKRNFVLSELLNDDYLKKGIEIYSLAEKYNKFIKDEKERDVKQEREITKKMLDRLNEHLMSKSIDDPETIFIFLITKEGEEFIRVSKKEKIIEKESFENYYTKANFYYSKGDYQTAIDNFTMALSWVPSDKFLDDIYSKLISIYYCLIYTFPADEDIVKVSDIREFLSFLVKSYKLHINLHEDIKDDVGKITDFLEQFSNSIVLQGIDIIEKFDFEIKEYKDKILPINHHIFLYSFAKCFIEINQKKAVEILQKALLYEYLVFRDKDKENILTHLKADAKEWKKLNNYSLEIIKKFQENLNATEDRSIYKRPFYEFCYSDGLEFPSFSTLLAKEKISLIELYNEWKTSYNKEKYQSFENSIKRCVKLKGAKYVIGSKEWFIEYILPKTKNSGFVEIDYLENTIIATSKFKEWYKNKNYRLSWTFT